MAYPNPAINPPVLSSSRRRLHSRSPSRSPARDARDRDPLLRDLSPTTILRAFASEPATGKHDSAVTTCFEMASHSERALGAKAAQACLDLRSWVRELESWEWPGTFDVPEPARRRMRMSMLSSGTAVTASEGEDNEQWGSLPAKTVQTYEKRAEEVGQQLDGIDVEEMKYYVLSAHQQAGSRRASLKGSISSLSAASGAGRLDDFTALITATILQALPYLSRVNRLLEVWTLRLSILRSTPLYLYDLKQACMDLDHGWAAIAVSPASAQSPFSASISQNTMGEMQSVVQQRVTELGRRLDGFLDELEGSEETVPDAWIEAFETLESAYGDWVVQAERKVLENELRMTREQHVKSVERKKAANQLSTRRPPYERRPSSADILDDATDSEHALFLPSPGPTEDVYLPQPFNGSIGLAREDSETLPNGERQQITMPKSDSEPFMTSDLINDSQTRSHPKYVPIVIDYHGDGQLYPVNGVTGDSTLDMPALPFRTVSAPLLGSSTATETNSEPNASTVKRRAAFLDANVDQSSSLAKQVKSPVRSFEHASNAFTRLFSKRGDRPKHLRRNSQKSNGKHSTETTKEAAKDEGVVWGGRRPPLSVTGGGRMSSGDASRNRSDSQRSIGSSRSRLTLTSMTGSEHTDRQSARRDNADMPGGFRSRSHSLESRQVLSMTQRTGYEGEVRRLRSLHRVPTETHKPRHLSSPFRPSSTKSPEHDYPVDWPLASPLETEASSSSKKDPQVADFDAIQTLFPDDGKSSSPEITSPRIPLDSNVFDQMFVASFPDTSEQPRTATTGLLAERLEPTRTRSAHDPRAPRRKRKGEPTLDTDMLGADGRQDDLSVATAGPSSPTQQRPKRVDLHHTTFGELNEALGQEASPGSINTELSEGEVHHARSTDYFQIQPSAEPVSRASSSATAKSPQSLSKSPSVSPMLLKLQIPDSQAGFSFGLEDDDQGDQGQVPIKRASLASMESRPRSMLKSIDVTSPRSSSNASTAPRISTPVSAIEPGGNSNMPGSPMGYNGMMFFPSPPRTRPTFPTSPVSPISAEQSPVKSRFAGISRSAFADANDVATYSPVSAKSEASPAPLNAAMAKRQGKRAANGAATTPKKQQGPLKPGEDSFDRHVSEVLERLPSTAIRFSSRPRGATPVQRTSEPRNYAGPRPKAGRVPSRASGGPVDLTLAPAETTPKKSASESEVKLYHLTQAGREEPIKLFVRLVGEGQRVMVRVGGGWADLADYLRQYAEHHGSRTVSGSGLEVQTAAKSTPVGRKASGSAAELKPRTPVTPAQTASGHASRDVDNNSTDALQPTINIDGGMLAEHERTANAHFQAFQPTPTNAPSATERYTPKSTSTKGASRPSTAGSLGRPQSKQGYRTDAGLSGQTSSKRQELPEQKVKWVEGMIERAKVASAEKGKDERAKPFGELGMAGGTRRVIFRQSSGIIDKGENARP
ncbi:hypothetical protein LTR08_001766 [Meristemomyces frigidus]|nr:hypothetical protein LTR08_001766 [Meristemomyces frigidus]